MRVECGLSALALLLVLVTGPIRAAAQSASQLGAWDGLMLSPVGALAPVAGEPGATAPGSYDLSLRYGRWRYDVDDVVHDNIGLTGTRTFGFARTQLSFTLAYGLVECPTCSDWEMGGVDLQSALWNRAFAPAHRRPITTGVALRVSVGGARYRGPGASVASSDAIALPIEVALPVKKTSSLRVSLIPGFGFGRIATTDVAESGVLPMLGAAVAWTMTSALSIDIGLQRVIIEGGPTQVGAAFSWKLGPHDGVRP